jgi:hypothetical protein
MIYPSSHKIKAIWDWVTILQGEYLRKKARIDRLQFGISITEELESYIIIHCHNPEGIELNSISQIPITSAEIYVDNEFLDYGAHDNETHNKKYLILSGSHDIKVIFNGIEIIENVIITSGQIKTITFIFTRTIYNLMSDIIDFFAGNIHATGNESFDKGEDTKTESEYQDGNYKIEKYFRGIFITGGCSISTTLIYDGWSFSRSVNISASISDHEIDPVFFNYGIWCNIDINLNTIISTNWYFQSITNGKYPRTGISYKDDLFFREIIPENGIGYAVRTCLAIDIDRVRNESLVSGGGITHYNECPYSYNYSFSESGNLFTFYMTSVPYDLLGTGV